MAPVAHTLPDICCFLVLFAIIGIRGRALYLLGSPCFLHKKTLYSPALLTSWEQNNVILCAGHHANRWQATEDRAKVLLSWKLHSSGDDIGEWRQETRHGRPGATGLKLTKSSQMFSHTGK